MSSNTIINALNQNSDLLHIYIVKKLKSEKYDVLSRYPVSASPFLDNLYDDKSNDSSEHISNKNAFVKYARKISSTTAMTKNTVDIVASVQLSCPTEKLHLCIESKDLNCSDWVFFKLNDTSKDLRDFQTTDIFNDDDDSVLLLTPKSPDKKSFCLRTRERPGFNYSIYDFGVSLSNKEEYFKSEKTEIDESAHHIIEACSGFMLDYFLENIVDNNNAVFVPIIVTNAKLYTCDNYDNLFDKETGSRTVNPDLHPVNGIVYECPIPPTVRFPDISLNSKNNSVRRKWHVLIVNPKGLNDLLVQSEHL